MRTYCQILGSYDYLDGCIQGNFCSRGKYCPQQSGGVVSGGPFEECQALAILDNADGFAYSSVYLECYMCTNSQLANLASAPNYGVYKKPGI